MKGFDILKVKSAVKGHNKFDLSRTHLTTMDFGEIVPLFVEETVPSDKFEVSADYFSRMAPLVKPTYGKFSFKTVAAFVPYHQLAVDSDAWFAGKTTWEGMTPVQRFIYVSDIDGFLRNSTTYMTQAGANSGNCDYQVIIGDGSVRYYKFTKRGKYAVKILNALGYALPDGVDMRTTSDWYTKERNKKLSAYPILAFAKLYNDYMSQSQRYNSSTLSTLLNSVKYGKTTTGYVPSSGNLTMAGLDIIFSNIFLNYENDYFTSAWQQPNNAINSIENINGISVPGGSGQGVVNDTVYDNTLSTPVVSSTSTIGQRALDFLKSFDDWVRRNNYSGSRAVQQIYSRFGIKTDDYRSHYANVISTETMPVQVGDIMSNASTDFTENGATKTSVVGDYVGKGIMNGQNSFSISVSDYGVILVLGYFTVAPMNAYGNFKHVLRNSPLDYYNPEFDGIGAEAISLGEVFCNPTTAPTQYIDSNVFGFTERYNAYRYGRDMITGEFRDFHNGDMNVWHTGRDLTALRDSGNLVAQSTSMNTLPQTDSEYNRIFSLTSGDYNHFYLTARFKVNALRPMLNLNQVVKLGEGDTIVPRNGNVIS